MSVKLQHERSTHRLAAVFASGLNAARQAGHPVLVSVVSRIDTVDPIDVFDRAGHDRVYWVDPGESLALCAAGSLATISDDTPNRYNAVRDAWKHLLDGAVIDAPAVSGTGPLITGGFSFDPLQERTDLWDGFPAALLRLPRFVVTTIDGESWLTVNALIDDTTPDIDALDDEIDRLIGRVYVAGEADTVAWPQVTGSEDLSSEAEWEDRIAALVNTLRETSQEKVVLARGVRLVASGPYPIAPVLRRLRASYPTCYTYAIAHGDRCLIGATPERLVRLHNGEIRTLALAGSTARGKTLETDTALGDELLNSPKNRYEHGIVVRAIYDALDGVAGPLSHADAPVLVKVTNVQHLATPITARILPGKTMLDLVERLHPTPGVGGYPRDTALQIIRDIEGLDRGWYAGAVGWLDARGEGDIAVVIRSALISGNEAYLFAGCGIVVGSDPASEYIESGLKLRPMQAALGATA